MRSISPSHLPLQSPIPAAPPQDFYSLTLDSMAESKNERLWFKTNMKLANLYVGLREVRRTGSPARVGRGGGGGGAAPLACGERQQKQGSTRGSN